MIVCIVIIEMLVVLSAFPIKGCSEIVYMLSYKTVVQNNQTPKCYFLWMSAQLQTARN